MLQVCFICSKYLNVSETVITEREIKTLNDSSVERNDGNFEYLKDNQRQFMYSVIWWVIFLFQKMLFICGDEANEEAEKNTGK